MTVKDVTKRYLIFCKYCVETGIVKDVAEFAKTIDFTKAAINEVDKGRSNVGLKMVQNTLLKYPALNPSWMLLGIGDMLENTDQLITVNSEINSTSSTGETATLREKILHLSEIVAKDELIISLLSTENLKLKDEVLKLQESGKQRLG